MWYAYIVNGLGSGLKKTEFGENIMKKDNADRLSHIAAKNIAVTVTILCITFALGFLLKRLDGSAVSIPMIFILSVFLIARFTTGYACSIISSFISVLGVNYLFTYPYFAFNFSIAGYPITILSMLAVSIITSMLTTRIKQQEYSKIETEIERTRGNLLRSVSHDLRTPLTSILGASSAVIENNKVLTDDEKLKLISEIKNDAQWLMQMVENLLSITKIGNDRSAEIIKKPEIVEEVIGDSLQKFRKRFPDFSVNVYVPDEPIIVPMDAILIEQVIINLLENAAVHSKTATETTLSVVSENRYILFTVCDNGVGISKEILPNIFDGCFASKSENNSDSKKNMGIGLSVCNTIIQVHGGKMTAENAKEGGAIFKFTLPKEKESNGI